jgi:hypothetical protein
VAYKSRSSEERQRRKIKRTGVVSVGQALDLARAAVAADGLRFNGPMTYPSMLAKAGFVAEAKRRFTADGIAISGDDRTTVAAGAARRGRMRAVYARRRRQPADHDRAVMGPPGTRSFLHHEVVFSDHDFEHPALPFSDRIFLRRGAQVRIATGQRTRRPVCYTLARPLRERSYRPD